MPELDNKAQGQDVKASPSVLQEKKPGFLYLIVFIIGIIFVLVGAGLFESVLGHAYESQLQSIFSTAMALCLSCIGLGKIKFGTLLDLSIYLAVFLAVYKLLELKNATKQ